VFSTPIIDGYSVERVHASNGRSTISITLQGTGFGEKQRAAPVLWVFGNDIRQNGERLVDPGHQIGEQVGKTGPKLWDHVDPNVVYDPLTRYQRLTHSYFTGQDGTVRNPLAFGGKNPPYADRTYLSARIKPSGRIHDYRGMGFSGLSGRFDLGNTQFDHGESITIHGKKGESKGTIIGIDEEIGLVTITWDTTRADADNALITGDSSGASLRLHPDQNYQNPGASKYVRMWSGGRPGLYATLSTNRIITGYRSLDGETLSQGMTDDGSPDRGYGIPNMSSSMDWRLLEIAVDQSGALASVYVDIDNSQRRYVNNIDTRSIKLDDRSPTISQLGWDAAGGRKDVHVGLHFGEIYFDTTPQRIMLSKETEYADSGNDLELQYPIHWSDNRIVFELRTGALDINEELYVYVFDKNSTANPTGLPICISCALSPPAAPTLQVR